MKWLFLTGLVLLSILGNGCQSKVKDGGEITITFAGASFPLFDQMRIEQARSFEKIHPGVRVRYEGVAGQDFQIKMLTQIAGGTPPDIFIAFGSNSLQEYARRDVLLDLTEYAQNDSQFNLDDYIQQVTEDYTYQGRLYGLAQGMGMRVLYYNKDHFDESGLSYPNDEWTWEDLLNAAKNLTGTDERGRVERFGIALGVTDPDTFMMFVKQAGGELFNKDRTRCIINTLESLEALKFLVDLSKKHHVSPTFSESRGQGAQLGGYSVFLTGRASMYIGGRWLLTQFRQKKELNYRFAMVPRGKTRAIPIDSMGWVAYKGVKHPQIVWEFIKHITSPDGQKYLVDMGDQIYSYKKMLYSDEFLHDARYPNEDNSVFIRSLDYGYTSKDSLCPSLNYYKTYDTIVVELQRLAIDFQTPEEALKNIEDGINKEIHQTR